MSQVLIISLIFIIILIIIVKKSSIGKVEEKSYQNYTQFFGEKVVELVNEERANYGLSPLVSDWDLKNAAFMRAQELTQYFSHTRPDGSDCFSILDELGISYGAVGENIAGGQWSPELVMESWMNSTGHRENILNADYTRIGVGCFYDPYSDWGYNWVQIFSN